MSLERNLVVFLLHDTPLSNKKYKPSLLKHFLIAAKACILALRKHLFTPTRSRLLARIAEIHQMENLTMAMKVRRKSIS